MPRIFLLCAIHLLLLLYGAPALAGDCRKISSVCIDAEPVKNIQSVDVTLEELGIDCWEYEDTYQCIKPNAVNYCQPFIDVQPQCWQESSACVDSDAIFGTGCMAHLQTFRCDDPDKLPPPNTFRLDGAYTLITSGYDAAQCASLDNNPNCMIAESKCTSYTPPPLPPGIIPQAVAADGCYATTNTYTCLTGVEDKSDCDGFSSNPDCSLSSQTCNNEDMFNGSCVFQTHTYKCMSSPPKTSQVVDCSGTNFCAGGTCFDTGYPNDQDFGQAMALMEAAREAGEYFDEVSIFGGFDSRCSIKFGGVSNCCKKSSGGGGYSNNALFGLTMEVGGVAYEYGSKYMYDALYDGVTYLGGPQGLIQQGMGVLAGVDPATTSSALSTFSPSFSMYGFTASMGATPAAGFVGQAIGVNTIPLGSFGGFNFAFDPTSFAISIAIMVITEMLACDPAEQLVSMRVGQDLCVLVGTYCSKKVLKVCTERKQTHCCFNSRLARIINEQGRAQLRKGWGTPEDPQCRGFTPGEIESIDFSQIDFSEFIAEIMGNLNLDAANAIGSNAGNVVQQKMQNYYERGYQ